MIGGFKFDNGPKLGVCIKLLEHYNTHDVPDKKRTKSYGDLHEDDEKREKRFERGW